MSTSSLELRLSRAARVALEAGARAALPEEACGCLIGRSSGPRAFAVRRAVRVRNVAPRRAHAFELDPGEIVRVSDEARAAGDELVGFWHSHPGGDASPSCHDERMTWAALPALIVALDERTGACRIRAWCREPEPG